MLEHGAYCLLLDHYYAEELPVPLDMAEVYTMVRAMTPADRKAVDKVLSKYFTKQDDGFHNERADHEIEVSRKARDNGKNGGRPGHEEATGSGTGPETEPVTGSQTGRQTGKGGGTGHPPTSNHQPPASSLNPVTASEPHSAAPASRSAAARKKDEPAKTAAIWKAYCDAYLNRWSVEPLRNAKVNGLLARFLDRVPVDVAPDVAAFFVRSNRGLYVSAKHAVDLLLRDAEGLHTEWLTGQAGTDTEARHADRTAATGNAFAPLIAEAEAREGITDGRK